jgi:hypothetical protein
MSRAEHAGPRRALLAAALLAPLAAQESAPVPAPPRLVVVVSVDQLATWVFERGLPHLDPDGGFQRLLRAGVRFTDCAYLHGCTETGPGHATIGTGAPANAHGIVKNEWFDRQLGKRRYCVHDPSAAAVPGMPEGRHRSPALLLQPTLGELLRTASPQSKVVSLACKDRSAILMGGKSANAVVWWEASTGRFVTNATWGAAAPRWLLEFDGKAAANGFFGWEWKTICPESAYADCTDDRVFEKPHLSSLARTLPVEVRGGKDEPGAAFYGEAFYSPIADELVLQVTTCPICSGSRSRRSTRSATTSVPRASRRATRCCASTGCCSGCCRSWRARSAPAATRSC